MNIPNPAKNSIDRLKSYFNSIGSRNISRISSDPLFKGIVIIGSGSAIAQIIGIICMPILTRIYSPEIFGILAVFSSLLAILIICGSFKYETAIPLPDEDEDAEYLVILSLFIVCSLTIILSIILTFFGDFLAGIFHFESIQPYYLLFCFGFFVICVYQIFLYWAIRSKDYFTITRTKIAQSISGTVSKIILGILSFGAFGLICGEVLGRIAGLSSLGRAILPKIWLSLHDFNFHKFRSLAYKYRKFPTFSLPAGLINEISLQIPILFLSAIFGFEIVGLYELSYLMLVLPVSLVGSSLLQVFHGETAEIFRHKPNEILALYQQTTKKLFMFGAPLILLGAVISPVVFPIIFGSAWKDAGMFSLPLSIMVIAQFVVSSTDRLDLYGYNHWALAWNIGRTIVVLAGFYFASLAMLSPVATILVFSLIMTIMYVICYILNIKAIKLVLHKKNILSKT
jgi:O-antigen/teichoic acid export membrane protein